MTIASRIENPSERIPPPRINVALGIVPGVQDRSVAFVANLKALFFGDEEKSRMLSDLVGEVDSYGGRLLPILDLLFRSNNGNFLLLERETDATLTRYLEEGLGLSLPERMVLSHSDYIEIGRALVSDMPIEHPAIERLAGHPSLWLDGYVTDEILAALADRTGKRTLSTKDGSRRGNDKLLLHRHLESIGRPVIPTELAASPGDVSRCLKALQSEGFRTAVVKAPLGASGIGLIKLPVTAGRLGSSTEVPEHFFREGPCLVQGWLEVGERGVEQVRSPSVQLFLDRDSVTLFDLTEQILSDRSVHEGNESPPPYLVDRPDLRETVLEIGAEAGRWLHGQGYRGPASVDYLIAQGKGTEDVYVCEINARVTGATYPAVLAHHLVPEGTWLMQNLRFREPVPGQAILDNLARCGDLFTRSGKTSGVLPLNFNTGPDGLIRKGQFLFLDPPRDRSNILVNMEDAQLPCVSDRD